METAVEVLVEAIEGLPPDLSNDELATAFAAYDRLTAWLSAAV